MRFGVCVGEIGVGSWRTIEAGFLRKDERPGRCITRRNVEKARNQMLEASGMTTVGPAGIDM